MKKSVIVIWFLLFSFLAVFPKGNWEFGIHYSFWSLNIAEPLIEPALEDAIDEYDPDKGNLSFDSGGNNYGFELRWFPGGENGSFSIGFSYERNNFSDITLNGEYDTVDAGNDVNVKADGSAEMFPHSFNINFRWELWPSSRVHPYIGIGVGIGSLEGSFKYTVVTTTYLPGSTVVDTESDEKTLKEAIDEGDGYPFGFMPIIHLQFGFRGRIINNLFALAEVAIFNGTIFRGGIAYRF